MYWNGYHWCISCETINLYVQAQNNDVHAGVSSSLKKPLDAINIKEKLLFEHNLREPSFFRSALKSKTVSPICLV